MAEIDITRTELVWPGKRLDCGLWIADCGCGETHGQD
jgi:hypothetical protein